MTETKNRVQVALDAAVRAGRTQKDIAAASGIDESTLCNYRSGARNPKVPNLLRLAKALGIPWQSLIEEGDYAATEDDSDAGPTPGVADADSSTGDPATR